MDAETAAIYTQLSDAEQAGARLLFEMKLSKQNATALQSTSSRSTDVLILPQHGQVALPRIPCVPRVPAPTRSAFPAPPTASTPHRPRYPVPCLAPIHQPLGREQIKELALSGHMTIEGPANPYQLAVLAYVYWKITPYPSESWRACIAIAIGRTAAQVKNWFSNQRQRLARDRPETHNVDLVEVQVGRRAVRLREGAVCALCDIESEWSVAGFEAKLAAFIDAM